MDEFECQACGSDEGKFLGVLGDREHYRCLRCGMESSLPVENFEDDEPSDGFLTDAEADADVLASAGYGTDEDYGYYGGNEDY